MKRAGWIGRTAALATVAMGLVLAAAPARAEDEVLLPPGNGTVRALVVGIDHYTAVNQLNGAVADARDVSGALAHMGATDVVTLVDKDATRAAVLRELDALLARTRADDLVIISLAGHGSKEDERIKGTSADGADEVFLLTNFDPKSATGATEKVLNHEFHHYIKLFESRGARLIFVADTCYGGGLAREVTVGSEPMTYRQVAKYRLADNDFKPISTPGDALLTDLDFDRTTFLAAVDDATKAPEVKIDGVYRGALSYAMARAFEGAADQKKDGNVTTRELFSYARKVVYQISDGRQNIVTEESPAKDLDREVVLRLGEKAVAQAALPIDRGSATAEPPVPIRLASSTGKTEPFKALAPLVSPFDVVSADDHPDLIWNSVTQEAIAGGDKVALNVTVADLPGVIDRTAAVRDIKALVVQSPQNIQVRPNDGIHNDGTRIDVEVGETGGRSLVLLDVTGDGTVQMLYPLPRDPALIKTATYSIPFQVRAPFGADEIVAVSAKAAMPDLVTALRNLDSRRTAGQVAGMIRRYRPADAKVGLVGLFTSPE